MPDRSELHKRIEKRFIKMMNEGFLEEVKNLRQNKNLNLDLPSMRCVGYRQAWQHLDGEFDKQTMIDKSTAATRQLCKRQCTWLRNENDALILKKSNIDKVVNFLQERGA
jgi:tRNA dimethylallyltransferase